MDLESIVVNNVNRAFNVLGTLAPTYTLIRTNVSFTPSTSTVSSSPAEETVVGFEESDIAKYYSNEPVPDHNLAIMIRGLNAAPKTGDKMQISEVGYRIKSVKTFKAGTTNALHLILLVR